MRRVKLLPALLALMMITFSIFTMIHSREDEIRSLPNQSVESGGALVFTTPLMVGMGLGDSNLLNQSTRMRIYTFVVNNPGVHFRGICSGLGMPVGAVQYHLHLLTNAGLLHSLRDRRYRRYFEAGRFDETEMRLISFLRRGTARKILAILLERRLMTHRDLASEVEVSSQALTWQMKSLRETGFIETEIDSNRVRYSINEDHLPTVKQCLDILN